MSLHGIKHYLHVGEKNDDAGRRAVSLLLAAIADFAIEANPEECESFRHEIRRIQVSAESAVDDQQMLAVVAEAVEALRNYHERLTLLFHRQASDLANLGSTVTHTLSALTSAGERSAASLCQIQLDLEQTLEIDEVQPLKARLRDCLEYVESEISRETQATGRVIGELTPVAPAEQHSLNVHDSDPITGLRNQESAEAAFQDALHTDDRKYVVVMVPDHLSPITARFGEAVRNDLLRSIRRYVEGHVMVVGDQLFQWRGSSFAALVYRPESLEQVRSLLRRSLDHRFENAVDIGGRQALIPVSLLWSVIPLVPPTSTVSAAIEQFVDTQTAYDSYK